MFKKSFEEPTPNQPEERKFDPSEVAFFHDQKSGDFDLNTMSVPDVSEPTFKKVTGYKEKVKREQEFKMSELSEQIDFVLSAIKSAELSSEFRLNLNQRRLLEEKKKQALNLISDIYGCIENYIAAVDEQTDYKKDEWDEKSYSLNEKRLKIHDRLIAKLLETIRFISRNFAEKDDEVINSWRERTKKSGEMFLEVERIELPQKIIAPDNLDLGSPSQIADCARQIYEAEILPQKQVPVSVPKAM